VTVYIDVQSCSREQGPRTSLLMPNNTLTRRRGGGVNSAIDLAVALYNRNPTMAVPALKELAKVGAITGGVGYAAKVAKQMIKTSSTPSLRGAKTNTIKSAPVSLGTTMYTSAPTITKSAKSQRVTHRELINASVNGTTSYTIVGSYPLQPGLATTFPWLSTIATSYEQFRFHKLIFHYVPFVATSTSGTTMLMADYNASDAVPTTETQFMDHPGATSAAVWEHISFRCSLSDLHALGPRRYIRNCATAGDIKTFDCGNFYIASDNCASAISSGKLYVEYDVELFTPQLVPSLALTPRNTSNIFGATNQAISNNVTSDVSWTTLAFDPLGWFPTYISGTFTPPAGCYKVTAYMSCLDTTNESFQIISGFVKNGLPYPSGGQFVQDAHPAGNNNVCFVSITMVVPLNGTDTFAVTILPTGAAGTLTIKSSGLIVELA